MKPHIYTIIEKEKYQVIITNPADGTVLDILLDRKQSHLISYFKKWNRDERSGVKFFVSDMLKPYAYTNGFTEGCNNKSFKKKCLRIL